MNLQVTPKLSASVNASLTKPDHCLEIFPTSVLPSADKTYKMLYPYSFFLKLLNDKTVISGFKKPVHRMSNKYYLLPCQIAKDLGDI